MKKLSLLIMLLCTSFILNAQEGETVEYPVGGDTELGVSLGLFSAYFADSEEFGIPDGIDTRTSLGLSVQYDYYFSKTWSIKAKLNYDPKGTGLDLIEEKVKLNYITLPVMANWHFGKRKRWYLNFGPYFGTLLSASFNGEDVKDDFKSTDFGFDLGIGVKIPIGGTMFFIETDGQSSFSTPSEDISAEDVRLSRSTLSVGILF